MMMMMMLMMTMTTTTMMSHKFRASFNVFGNLEMFSSQKIVMNLFCAALSINACMCCSKYSGHIDRATNVQK
jgi:hypothetical protein